MSQKNETFVLLLSLLLTLGLLGSGVWWFLHRSEGASNEWFSLSNSNTPNRDSLKTRMSWGEQSLLPGTAQPAKQAGLSALAAEQYDQAISEFTAALKANRNDPEAVIFLNNAQIGDRKSYAIAVAVPISTDLGGALEMLRGVAQAQAEINRAGGINGVPLKVAIANDENDPQVAQQLAQTFIKNQEILGVVGHYSSGVTLAAGPTYQDGKLVVISPVSTSVKLSGLSPYVFRTVPSDYVAARALSDYLLTQWQQQNAVVFFNSQSAYSQSLKAEFVTALSLGGGEVLAEVDLADPSFSAAKSLEQALQQKAQAIMLAADTSTLDKALQVVQLNRKRLKLLAGDDVYTLKTLEVGADAAEGMVLAVPWHIQGNLQSTFPQQARQWWGGDVNWRTALAYDAAQALIAALKQNPSRTGVQQSLATSGFTATGASGTVRFLPSGDRSAPAQLVTIVEGQRSGTGYDFVPLRAK